MYRGSSPIFDVPEFPSMRRVKPLPKRRRTFARGDESDQLQWPNSTTDTSGAQDSDELIANADAVSTQIIIQSYYAPILSGYSTGANNNAGALDLGYHSNGRMQDDERSADGDYIDHLQQPGNTKKRKVPTNTGASPHSSHDEGVPLAGQDHESGVSIERSPALAADREGDSLVWASGASNASADNSSTGLRRRGMLSTATMAGLQHKEMLRQRKRQLAAVLGAISHEDTLALDQALISTYAVPSATAGADSQQPRVRLSRRNVSRIARRVKSVVQVDLNASFLFPTAFTFVCHSPTSERLVAVKEEVALLRKRFEAEFTRQSNKAAEAAAVARQAALAASVASRAKGARTQQRSRMPGRVEDRAESVDQNLLGGSSKSRSKKKKRSALAIAANPHHRRNYVPSRLPQSGQANPAQAALNAQNYLGPPPFRFLSAEIPQSHKGRKNGKGTITPTVQLTNPADEWICSFCEYKLFYGGDAEYRRAIRRRKKILRRRRRAERRAANVTAKVPAATQDQDQDYDDYDAGFSVADYSGNGGNGRSEGVKGERGGDHIHSYG